MTVRRWRFRCPECEFDDEEAGRLATDAEVYCGLCAGDCGRDVQLVRWLAEGVEPCVPGMSGSQLGHSSGGPDEKPRKISNMGAG